MLEPEPAVRVYVYERQDRPNYYLKWICPATGRWRVASSRTPRRREAERRAAKLGADLASGLSTAPPTWEQFAHRYLREHLVHRSPGSTGEWLTVEKAFRELCRPRSVQSVTQAMVTSFDAQLCRSSRARTTVAKYLRTLVAALNWARRQGFTTAQVRAPKNRGRTLRPRMKGRPLAVEEIERMVEAAEYVCGQYAGEFQRLITGMALSGLRLGEAMDLWWDDPEKIMPLDLETRRPILSIPGLQKSGEDSWYPLTPDFAGWLAQTPERERTGPVFAPVGPRGWRLSIGTVGKRIAQIGKKANVVSVAKKGQAPKYASSHDLRRTFGTRWAMRLAPALLQQLMRHESIATTMTYYVAIDSGDAAEQIAAVCDAEFGTHFRTHRVVPPPSGEVVEAQ